VLTRGIQVYDTYACICIFTKSSNPIHLTPIHLDTKICKSPHASQSKPSSQIPIPYGFLKPINIYIDEIKNEDSLTTLAPGKR
jgi:hypothetical protein